MKYLASVYTLITIFVFTFFLLPQFAFADTYVSQSSNGSSSTTINVHSDTGGNSINDDSVTSENTSHSTVCCNGQCITSDDGSNIDTQNGGCNIHINNNGTDVSTNSVTETPVPTDVSPTISDEPSISPVPTMTVDPTITQMRKQVRKQIKEQIKQLKEHMKDQNAAFSSFIQSEMNQIHDLLNGLFK
ncbi:MAG TPA: hypothetical protein VLF93_04100 [Candidatus Saccharimonadales bacterium]|nr:hypothetical protein [Candidatus Saccharimonadales bacterium]